MNKYDWTVVGFRALAVGVGMVGLAFALFFLWGGVSTLLLVVKSFGYLIGALLLFGLGILVVVFFSWVVLKLW